MRLDNDISNKLITKIEECKKADIHFSHTTEFSQRAKWLVLRLMRAEIPYMIQNAGAGVKIITTETDKCPLCKGKLK